jgi:4-hydroxy-2-oxoheptanedioate aldolase
MFRPNRLKARILAGEKSLGTWVQSANPTLAEMAAVSGFDFIIIDQEHGLGDLQMAVDMMRAASGAPATAVIRIPPGDPTYAKRLVDAGAEAILVPMVETAEQARQVVEACRFPPQGNRGNAWDVTRSSSYGFVPDYYERAAANLLIIVQIETATAVANAKEIAEVDGVDLLFIGPSDLSSSIGLPGQTGAPEVERLIQQTVDAVVRVGKPLATVPRHGRTWQQLFDDGFVAVPTGSDIAFYRQSLTPVIEEYRKFSSLTAAGSRQRNEAPQGLVEK